MTTQSGDQGSLESASADVAALIDRLREHSAAARRQHERAAQELRRLTVALDELQMQHSVAQQLPGALLDQLRARESELRERVSALQEQAAASQEAHKRLEQLLRQIEMSSSVLSGSAAAQEHDPWLLALKAQIVHGREEERLRLAREIHDGTAQVMANVQMGLEQALRLRANNDDRLDQLLTQLRDAAKLGLQEVRGFIADLRPGAVLEHGARAAITDYAQRTGALTGLHVTCDLAEWPAALPVEAEIVLYRVVQEALNNIRKHARGAHVLIRSIFRQQTLTLSIRDDGPGFNPREVAQRTGKENWGLSSMRERAALIGGSFSIASRPGAGVEVTVTLPVRE